MVDSQLESWIEEQIQNGHSLEQIENNLRKQGWDEESIQEAENLARQRLNTNQTPAQNKESSSVAQGKQSDNLNYAGLGKRAVAYIADTILVSVLYALLIVFDTLIRTFAGPSIFFASDSLILISLVTVFFGYFIVFEGRSGHTPGKKIVDIQVLNTDGSAIGYKESIIRNILRPIDWLMIHLVGIVAILATNKSQRVGDLIARTIVVKELKKEK